MENNIQKAERFLREAFVKNPGYSFGDPEIMIGHSRTVRDVSLRIAKRMECDKELLEIMALWHDIGKAHEADWKVLRERHDELGYEVTKDILPELNLSVEQKEKLVAFLRGDLNSSSEAKMAKDADIIAFFADEKLQAALKEWADGKGFSSELQRKIAGVDSLRFEISKELVKRPLEAMKKYWNLS